MRVASFHVSITIEALDLGETLLRGVNSCSIGANVVFTGENEIWFTDSLAIQYLIVKEENTFSLKICKSYFLGRKSSGGITLKQGFVMTNVGDGSSHFGEGGDVKKCSTRINLYFFMKI